MQRSYIHIHALFIYYSVGLTPPRGMISRKIESDTGLSDNDYPFPSIVASIVPRYFHIIMQIIHQPTGVSHRKGPCSWQGI